MISSFYFDPDARGLRVFLGSTEVRLMELAWDHGPITVKKALFLWDSKPKPAYTTLMTVLSRLAEKGLMERVKDGRSFQYRPRFDRKEFIEERLSRLLTCLRTNFPQSIPPSR
jgi:predicted transcriptional regulator